MPLVLLPLKKAAEIDKNLVEQLAKELKCTRLFAEVLYNRGYDSIEKCRNFLYPDDRSIYDPFLLKNMNAAVSQIKQAIIKKSKITVYGDYDVDGISAAALIYKVLQSFGANVDSYIPDRHTEGYGLNSSAIEAIAEAGTKLLITVDCGISAVKEVKLAQQLGMEVLVTDHHAIQNELPDCTIINPLQEQDIYPFKKLCGAGIALKVAQALLGIENAMEYLAYSSIHVF